MSDCFCSFLDQIDNPFPADWLLQFAQVHLFIFLRIVVKDFIKYAMLAFTDSSSNGRTAYAINDKGYVIQTAPDSAQIVELQELQAVAMDFQLFVHSLFN